MHKPAKKTHIGRIGILIQMLLTLAAFSACSPSLTVALAPEGSASLNWKGTMSPTSQTLIARFSNQKTGESLFKPADIRLSLALAGIAADSIATPDSATLAIAASIPDTRTLPAGCVRFDSAKKEAVVTLSREVLSAALEVMPADTADYLDLLMAPVFTGEAMTPEEYRDLVAAAYGKTLAAELASSAFTLTLSCPGTIESIQASPQAEAKKSGKAANITVPLDSLLTLNEPIIIRAAW